MVNIKLRQFDGYIFFNVNSPYFIGIYYAYFIAIYFLKVIPENETQTLKSFKISYTYQPSKLHNKTGRQTLNCNSCKFIRGTQFPNTTVNNPNAELIFGILTHQSAFLQRQVLRDTYIRDYKFYGELIDYKFLLDFETKKLSIENEKYHDILFLNATYTGKSIGYGEKLLIFYDFVVHQYPKARLVTKMDDDVYLCVNNTISRLLEFGGDLENLYFGWAHSGLESNLTTDNFDFQMHDFTNKKDRFGKLNRVDEQFVTLGVNLVKTLQHREYCYGGISSGKLKYNTVVSDNCDIRHQNVDNNFAGKSLASWLGQIQKQGSFTKTHLNSSGTVGSIRIHAVFDNFNILHYESPLYSNLNLHVEQRCDRKQTNVVQNDVSFVFAKAFVQTFLDVRFFRSIQSIKMIHFLRFTDRF